LSFPGIIIDTFAWLEILKGSERGAHALEIIEKSAPCSISVLTLYELRYRVEQLKNKQSAEAFLATITANVEVILVDERVAVLAGELKLGHPHMGAVDCVILATGRLHGMKVLTGDTHFNGSEDATLI
jgi:predicted nucleic acid-binding protein